MAPSTDTSGMEFEVFLSFRGPDTRVDFTSFLYHDMVEKGIRVFKDDKELNVGEKIEKIFKALNDSQIYIPILSKDFASSAWCLREVVRMVDCAKNSNGKKEIFPIFLDVKPEDVKSSTGLYSNALSLLKEEKAKYGDEEETLKYDPDEVKSWRDALREVASITGWKREGKEKKEMYEQSLWRSLIT
ncbi:toll/interleukin-1 receptor-like protein [Eucalyptus grandis]|uniref:toll/interleukin-1 receptor-like protein n=1 Tax=Eucalyptus grandis TaxID=71139 RepID=UPI00192EDB7D|nr:toll/interleukin-1 receptor-like protein [Eucalyptus grandis]